MGTFNIFCIVFMIGCTFRRILHQLGVDLNKEMVRHKCSVWIWYRKQLDCCNLHNIALLIQGAVQTSDTFQRIKFSWVGVYFCGCSDWTVPTILECHTIRMMKVIMAQSPLGSDSDGHSHWACRYAKAQSVTSAVNASCLGLFYHLLVSVVFTPMALFCCSILFILLYLWTERYSLVLFGVVLLLSDVD